jgi:hypothetical protein
MYRLVIMLLVFSLWGPWISTSVAAQNVSDEQAAATTAVELSELEALGDFTPTPTR